MRRLLDNVYLAAGVLAGCCMVGIFGLILIQISSRLLGVFVRGTDQFSGYLLAGATFLALAYTFRTDGHIRVTLVLEHIPGKFRRALEILALLAATVVIGYFAWQTIVMVWQSHIFKQSTHGLVAIPLWIPQIVLPVGLSIMFVAVVDALVACLRGETPNYLAAAADAHGDTGTSDASAEMPDTLRGQ